MISRTHIGKFSNSLLSKGSFISNISRKFVYTDHNRAALSMKDGSVTIAYSRLVYRNSHFFRVNASICCTFIVLYKSFPQQNDFPFE